MNGNAQHKSPNQNAPVTGVALRGERNGTMVPKARPSAADRDVNSKSSNNTPNLARQNQTRGTSEP